MIPEQQAAIRPSEDDMAQARDITKSIKMPVMKSLNLTNDIAIAICAARQSGAQTERGRIYVAAHRMFGEIEHMIMDQIAARPR